MKVAYIYLNIFAVYKCTEANMSAEIPLDGETVDKLYHALKYVPYVNLKLRASSKTDNKYINFFIKQTVCPIFISTYTENDLNDKLANTRDSFAIETTMESLSLCVSAFSQKVGLFFFIITNTIDQKIMKDVFSLAWYEKGLVKAYILTLLGIFTYDPFAYNIETKSYGAIVQDRNYTTFFHNMNGYPIRVQLFRSVYSRPIFDKKTKKILTVEGADAKVAFLLEKKMNFTLALQEPHPDLFGYKLLNGSFSGTLGMMLKNETDICFTGFFIKDYLTKGISFTVAVYSDSLCCYVPKAPRIPQSILPIFALHYSIWISYIMSAFVCGTIWTAMRRINLWIIEDDLFKLNHCFKNNYQYIRIYMDTWVVWVRVNIVRYPPFYSERFFVISLCLVSVIFGAIFESSLATVYIRPLYYKDITNLKELDESGFDIIYKHASMKDDLFFNETSKLFASLNKKLKYLSDISYDVIHDMATDGGAKIASVTRYSSLMLESIRYIRAEKITYIPECPNFYDIAYVLPADSSYEERINDLLLRFLNAGLIEQWINEMFNEAQIAIMQSQLVTDKAEFKVLNLADLQLAFYVVFLGNMIAAICFLLEFFLKKKKLN